jgi:hypothetical protein
MSETPINLDDAMPCPTCAALVLRADIDEHQRWHAGTESGGHDTRTGSSSA